jgi:branched-chain amino acid transport system permease protein
MLLGLAALCLLPLQIGGVTMASSYLLALIIQIAIYGIAALGLNILVGFTGQISLGHAAFFGFGAFSSAYLSGKLGVPVALSIPLAGVTTALVGTIVGLPAGRLKGLYLAIATLASQFVLQDFFGRADWFTGGASGANAASYKLFGVSLSGDRTYIYVVLAHLVVLYVFAANLMRTRDGRAMVAVRDHYLSAEIMGINLTYYRVLAFAISSFYAGIAGALMAHYTGFVSGEAFDLLLSVNFLAMIIIGGLGSVMGSLMGAAFIIYLPEFMQGAVRFIQGLGIGNSAAFNEGLAYMKEMAIGLAIVLFLVFEPDGLAARWRKIKAYWKLYPFSY